MLNDCRSRSVDSGLSRTQVDCIYSEGQKFAPEVIVVDGAHQQCYNHEEFGVYMAHAVASCVAGFDEDDLDELDDRQQLVEKMDDNVEERLIRQPVAGDSVVARVARLLSMKTSRRSSCRCSSGCHYCCVLVGVGGDDKCFQMVCKGGSGYCA
ncbi:unnamed protein product [Agarophyton chilense]